MKTTMIALAASAAMFAFSGSAYAECGEVSIAEMDWASAEMIANIDKTILEAGYGCKVTLQQGGTTNIFASMENKGQPDVAPELWINAVREPLSRATESGDMVIANEGPIEGLGEGWWVTPEFAKANPDIKSVEDLLARPELVPHPEDPSKGGFVTCPAGWGCQLANANLFRAFEMEKKGWKMVDPGSAAGLDGSMTKAVQRGEPWFGYYWTPTAMIGKNEMVKLPFETEFAGSENWDGCIVKSEQECADPKPSAWTQSEVKTVVTDDFKEKGGADALAYLEKRVFPGDTVNEMLVYMADEQATGEDAAIEFLKTKEDVWSKWVSPEAAEKIKASL